MFISVCGLRGNKVPATSQKAAGHSSARSVSTVLMMFGFFIALYDSNFYYLLQWQTCDMQQDAIINHELCMMATMCQAVTHVMPATRVTRATCCTGV